VNPIIASRITSTGLGTLHLNADKKDWGGEEEKPLTEKAIFTALLAKIPLWILGDQNHFFTTIQTKKGIKRPGGDFLKRGKKLKGGHHSLNRNSISWREDRGVEKESNSRRP